MNNDTEKADELLRKKIATLKARLSSLRERPEWEKQRLIETDNRLRTDIKLYETIQRDREALRSIQVISARTVAAIPEYRHEMKTVEQALASQDETLIKLLS